MTDNELRKLTRADLLDLLLIQSREIDKLKQQLAEAEKAASSKIIELEEAGSIAEAALRINGIFESAQKACDQYVESVKAMKTRVALKCDSLEQEAEAKLQAMEQEFAAKYAEKQAVFEKLEQEYNEKTAKFKAEYEQLKNEFASQAEKRSEDGTET